MIKFFRRIRQQLLSKNKLSKYLLYALGEIVLVVIGILIAFNVNKYNEESKKVANVEGILADLMVQLENDISVSTDIIADYQLIDSLASLVLDGKVKREDYTNGRNIRLNYLIEAAHYYTTNHNAYDVLVNNIGNIPSRFNGVMNSLSLLYEHKLPELDAYNDRMRNITDGFHAEHAEKYDWYYQIPYHTSEGAIEYKLHDPKYKNKVRRVWWEGTRTHRQQICDFRIAAIDNYTMIAKVLDKPTDSLNFILKKELLESYAGIYKDIDGKLIELKIEGDHFIMINGEGPGEKHVYPLTNTSFFIVEGGIIKFEENNGTDSQWTLNHLSGYASQPFKKTT